MKKGFIYIMFFGLAGFTSLKSNAQVIPNQASSNDTIKVGIRDIIKDKYMNEEYSLHLIKED